MLITVNNYAYVQNAPEAFVSQLKDILTLDNPKYLENLRMKRWNKGTKQTLTYYSQAAKTGILRIPRGFLPQLLSMCRAENIAFTLNDQRQLLPHVDFNFSGQLKDFQIPAVKAMLKNAFGTLEAPTGSGKTVMALALIAARKQPALIVVHTKELAEQWMDRTETFLNIPRAEIGFIGNGKWTPGEKITIAMVQSLYKIAHQVAPTIGYLLVDECHRCPSRMFTEAVTSFNCQFMTGLSATPFRRDKLEDLIFWHLGDIRYRLRHTPLIQTGAILPVRAIFCETSYEPSYKKPKRKGDKPQQIDPITEYSRMIKDLTEQVERNRQIVADIVNHLKHDNDGGIILVLSDRKTHCETLAGMLAILSKQEIAVLTGDKTATDRQEIVEKLRAGKVHVLIATGQLIGEGFDLPELSTLFLTTPIGFKGRLLQYLGRVLRPAKGKDIAVVYDYVDIKVGVLKNAAKNRERLYQSVSNVDLFDIDHG